MNKRLLIFLTMAMLCVISLTAKAEGPVKLAVHIHQQDYQHPVRLWNFTDNFWVEQGVYVEASANKVFTQMGASGFAMCSANVEAANLLVWLRPNIFYNPQVNTFYGKVQGYFYTADGKPLVNIDTIKIYKITHGIITVQDLARDFDPLDKTLFYPYFLGTFDKTGKLLDPEDPFLYFLLPITRTMDPNQPSVLTDSLEIHAGDQKPAPAKEEAKQ